jgi:hypothetical protein
MWPVRANVKSTPTFLRPGLDRRRKDVWRTAIYRLMRSIATSAIHQWLLIRRDGDALSFACLVLILTSEIQQMAVVRVDVVDDIPPMLCACVTALHPVGLRQGCYMSCCTIVMNTLRTSPVNDQSLAHPSTPVPRDRW